MSYNIELAGKIRESLSPITDFEEKEMMGGLTFMVNDKMCVGIIKDEMMCRIDPSFHEEAVEMNGCRTMDFTKRPMKGYVMVEESVWRNPSDRNYWIGKCLEFNKIAKSSKKKK